MKVTIRANAEGCMVVAELFVGSCDWELGAQRLYMTHGIGDGYYRYPIETDIIPLRVQACGEGMAIDLENSADVHRLAALLKENDDHCQASFGRMRV